MKTRPLFAVAASATLLLFATGCSTYSSTTPAYAMHFTSTSARLTVRPMVFDQALNTTIRILSVDGQAVTETAAPAVPLEPGKHEVKVMLDSSDHRATHTLSLNVNPSKSYRLVGQQDGLDFELKVWDETMGHAKDERVLVSVTRVASEPRPASWPAGIKQTPSMTGDIH